MVTVRDFIATDAEPVQLIMTMCTSELRAVYVPKPQPKAVLANHSLPNSRVVAVDNTDTVVGVAECITHPSALYIQSIAVAPTYRRCGVAGALLSYIATLAVDLGFPVLSVATIKETGNVEIFKRLGFAVAEERVSERFLGTHGQPVTEVGLKRNLT